MRRNPNVDDGTQAKGGKITLKQWRDTGKMLALVTAIAKAVDDGVRANDRVCANLWKYCVAAFALYPSARAVIIERMKQIAATQCAALWRSEKTRNERVREIVNVYDTFVTSEVTAEIEAALKEKDAAMKGVAAYLRENGNATKVRNNVKKSGKRASAPKREKKGSLKPKAEKTTKGVDPVDVLLKPLRNALINLYGARKLDKRTEDAAAGILRAATADMVALAIEVSDADKAKAKATADKQRAEADARKRKADAEADAKRDMAQAVF